MPAGSDVMPTGVSKQTLSDGKRVHARSQHVSAVVRQVDVAEKVLFVGKAMRVLQHPSASTRRPRRDSKHGD